MDPKEIELEGVDWINRAEDRTSNSPFVNMMTNLWSL